MLGRSNIEFETVPSSSRSTKIIFKSKSTMFSGISNMNSLTSQVTLDHESVITNPAAVEPDKCYTLVDKICFIKKTQDQLKVTFPDGQS